MLEPVDGAELEGWPVDMRATLTGLVHLDNDGDLEVTARKSGMAYVFHHDATPYNNFPASLVVMSNHLLLLAI